MRELARLHEITQAELFRRWLDREWREQADALRAIDDAFAKARKKRAA